MKGLIRNNFYSVSSTLKWTIVLCLVLNIAVIIGAWKYPSSGSLLPILMLGQIGAFVGLTGTALQKDNASKWNIYERILPVRICDVVKARYISFLIFSMIGVLLASITVFIFFTISASSVNLERVGYGYSFGITFALLVPSLLYPLVLKFGSDKSEVMLLASILITMVLFVGGSVLLAPFIGGSNSADSVYRTISLGISVVFFLSSYFLSLMIYKRKEL